MATITTPDLAEVFNAVEAADTDFKNKTAVVNGDSDAVTATQAKLANQQATLATDTATAHDSLVARNVALKSASDAFLAAILPE